MTREDKAMTRFERELSGALGDYWKTSAEKELIKIREELEQGLITIDENGVARNRICRVLMSDMLEKLTYITDAVDAEATAAARDEEVSRSLSAYRENRKPVNEEEKNEMRAAFGKGQTVVDILTCERITL